jgi:hypothetical protein
MHKQGVAAMSGRESTSPMHTQKCQKFEDNDLEQITT